jgi:hypothetical protein
MKLRSIVFVLTVVLASSVAKAQSGFFVTMDAQQFTQDGYRLNPAPGSANVDRPWLFGPSYGAYFDIHHIPYTQNVHVPSVPYLNKLKAPPIVVGIDFRGDTYRLNEYGSQLDRQDGILSLRIAPKKEFMGTTPYVIGGFGIAHTRIPYAANYTNNIIYAGGIGADRKIAKHIDWRMFEARASVLGHYQVANTPAPNQSNYLITIGTGLVFRVH